jgi:hypothetical protein
VKSCQGLEYIASSIHYRAGFILAPQLICTMVRDMNENSKTPRVTSPFDKGPTKGPSGWNAETVVSFNGSFVSDKWRLPFLETCLAYTTAGEPRLVYHDSIGGRLMYASKHGGTWSVQQVGGDIAINGSVANLVLKDDLPWISYWDHEKARLMCARKDFAGGWHFEEVGTGRFCSTQNALAMGPDGQPHIAYIDLHNPRITQQTEDYLYYTYRSVIGGWHAPVVIDTIPIVSITPFTESIGLVGVSIAINPVTGLPAIAYAAGEPERYVPALHYAWKDAFGSWQHEYADKGFYEDYYGHTEQLGATSGPLAFNANGNAHVSYFNSAVRGEYPTVANMMMGQKIGASWDCTLLPFLGGCYLGSSLIISNSGLWRVGYIDWRPQGGHTNYPCAKFAWQDESKTWHAEDVDLSIAPILNYYWPAMAIHRPTGKMGMCYVTRFNPAIFGQHDVYYAIRYTEKDGVGN